MEDNRVFNEAEIEGMAEKVSKDSAMQELLWSIMGPKYGTRMIVRMSKDKLKDRNPEEIIKAKYPDMMVIIDAMPAECRDDFCCVIGFMLNQDIFMRSLAVALNDLGLAPLAKRCSDLERQNQTYVAALTPGQTGTGGSN